MTFWKICGRGPLGRAHVETVELPTAMSATAAREALLRHLERNPARPSLSGVRLAAPGSPWINAGQFRGKESAEIVAMILSPAILARPSWFISCPQDGQWRPWGAPFEAASLPLPIASRGQTNAITRYAAATGQRWARTPITVYHGITS
jgi:hypothetical protein